MARVVDLNHEHEAVKLGLGERVGALLFDGVLGGQHEEGVRELVASASARHLSLDHRFEERGLSLRRCPVDLVREDDVREERAGLEAEGARRGLRVHVQELRSSDVRWHQVWSELNALEVQVERAREARHEESLGEAWDSLEEAVPPS